jgi:PBP1b-binding outer membrane lipoprotein LpoB
MNKTRKKVAVASLVVVALLLSGCASASSSAPITPAPDKPTFLYFFTDG